MIEFPRRPRVGDIVEEYDAVLWKWTIVGVVPEGADIASELFEYVSKDGTKMIGNYGIFGKHVARKP